VELNDVIALPPVVEDDWDAVLTEAKDAGIPVIIVDRSVSADKSLYAAHIGSDMVLEGKKAGDGPADCTLCVFAALR
jgi:galactofuranose transport system substrate-binding protein